MNASEERRSFFAKDKKSKEDRKSLDEDKLEQREENVFKRAMVSSGNLLKSLGKSTVKTLTTPPSFLNFSSEKSPELKHQETSEALMVLDLLKTYNEMFDFSSTPRLPSEALASYRRIKKERIDNKDFLFTMCCDAIYTTMARYDCWSTLVLPVEQWRLPSRGMTLVPTEITTEGWNIENNDICTTYNTPLAATKIVNFEEDFPFYKKFFYGNDKVKHYLSKEESVVVSVQRFAEVSRAILRTKLGFFRCLLGPEGEKPELHPKLFKDPKKVIKLDNDPELDECLLEMESKTVISHYKFGVLYVRPDQTDENGFFHNTEDVCSPAFWKFMDLIGTKRALSGFDGYRGGLDVKSGTTGEFSYISHCCNYEIMFHVSPLLPVPKDEQALERKRHIGNDVVVLIFKDQSSALDQFDPRWLTSHFNSIFMVVSPETPTEDNTRYRITVSTLPGINPFPPFVNETGVYEHNDVLRDFVLRKLINGERTAMLSPTFDLNARKTRKQQLDEFNEHFYKQDIFSQLIPI